MNEDFAVWTQGDRVLPRRHRGRMESRRRVFPDSDLFLYLRDRPDDDILTAVLKAGQ